MKLSIVAVLALRRTRSLADGVFVLASCYREVSTVADLHLPVWASSTRFLRH